MVLWGQLGVGHDNTDKSLLPTSNPYFIKNKIQIIDIASGYSHNLCIDNNGICYGFGYNKYGQCGVGNTTLRISSPHRINISSNYKIKTIKAGCYHSYICSKNNKHFLFGSNGYNQCTLSSAAASNQQHEDKVTAPLLINDIFSSLTNNNKSIKDMYLGYNNTWIITAPPQDEKVCYV